MDELVMHLRDRRITVLTGAGMSTDSGIPDYRGPRGSLKKRTPVQYAEFLRSEADRRRYWARSCLGWPFMTERRPNAGHLALARLQNNGPVLSVITQNVDGLHQAAGSRDVLELHGGLDGVVCLGCGARTSRDDLQERMLARNPGWLEQTAEAAPDGDAELPRRVTDHFHVPDCSDCGGILKPDVVFFGENVPAPRVTEAFRRVDEGEVLLVLGSSLTVYSGYRFVDHAVRKGTPVVIVNQGETRGDPVATLRIDAGLIPVLEELVRRLIPQDSGPSAGAVPRGGDPAVESAAALAAPSGDATPPASPPP
jgi:NAD+-dependent protein deacetylase sirtuin 4